MEKAVLISIRPEWCEKIATGEKTIEVRKSRPKLDTPFKCYIYCTFGEQRWRSLSRKLELFLGNGRELSNGKVIGEFMCDAIDQIYPYQMYCSDASRVKKEILEDSCLTYEELCKYGNAPSPFVSLYCWHISDLVIYDEPKPLSDFRIPCKEYERDNPRCGGCDDYHSMGEYLAECDCDGLKPITRAPQSWCYVEPVT